MFSGSKQRWLDPLERVFLGGGAAIQISLEFETSDATERAVKTAFSSFNALKLKNGRFKLYEMEKDPTVFKIPSELNSLKDVNTWMSRAHRPGFSDGLATIAVDERRLVINTSHAAADGVYMAKLIEQIGNPKESWPTSTFPLGPMKLDYDEIMKYRDGIYYAGMEPDCLRLQPRHEVEKEARIEMSIVHRNSRDLVCWDHSNSRVKGMSEALWTSMALVGVAHQNKLPDPIKLMTCTNRRNAHGCGIEAGMPQNGYTEVCVDAHVSPDMTVGEMGRVMRASFDRAIARKDYSKFMKGAWKMIHRPWNFWFGKQASGLGFDMSSIGPIRISKPVKDAYLTSIATDPHPGNLFCFMTFSLVDEERNRNEFVGQIDYSSLELHKEEGDAIAKGFEHCLVAARPNMRVDDVIAELRQIQHIVS